MFVVTLFCVSVGSWECLQALSKEPVVCAPEELGSEDMLFMLYTSGSTGKPKGVVHTQAGYILYAGLTHQVSTHPRIHRSNCPCYCPSPSLSHLPSPSISLPFSHLPPLLSSPSPSVITLPLCHHPPHSHLLPHPSPSPYLISLPLLSSPSPLL